MPQVFVCMAVDREAKMGVTSIVFSRLIFLLVLGAARRVEAQNEPCACTFTSTDPEDCRVYGQTGNHVLIPWYKANRTCLDVFNIKDQVIDNATLTSIFPEPGSPANVNALVSFLKFNSGTVATGVKLSLPDFFNETSTGGAQWAPRIQIDGKIIDCEQATSDCWNALKTYFNQNPDVTAGIGKTLYDQQRLSKEKEQSLVRIRLCQDGPTPACGNLSHQVQEKVDNQTSCSSFGLGPGNRTLSFCGQNAGSSSSNAGSSSSNAGPSGTANSGTGGTSSATLSVSISISTACCFLLANFVNMMAQ